MSGKWRAIGSLPNVALQANNTRMMQTIRQAFLLLIVAIFTGCITPAFSQSLPASQLTFTPGTHVIPFHWQGDSVHAQWEPHAAMLIPVKLKGCPRQLYMQFDLGAPASIVYQNKLNAIREKYPQAGADSLQTIFHFTAGNTPVSAHSIPFMQFDSSSINWNTTAKVIIGTIGADFIDGHVAVIDYPKRRITIAEAVPKKTVRQIRMETFVYMGRRILLPSTILGQQKLLFFDTGSSMYSLLTDKATCEQLAIPGTPVLQSKSWSWNKWLMANTMATSDSIEIASLKIPIRNATYMEGTDPAQAAQMRRMGIGGMTGNKLFLPYKLVLDTKNKMFGLIR